MNDAARRAAYGLARKFGHWWAQCAPVVEAFLAGNGEKVSELEELALAWEWAVADAAHGRHIPWLPVGGIESPDPAAGFYRHTTCTGRTSWAIDDDGVAVTFRAYSAGVDDRVATVAVMRVAHGDGVARVQVTPDALTGEFGDVVELVARIDRVADAIGCGWSMPASMARAVYR